MKHRVQHNTCLIAFLFIINYFIRFSMFYIGPARCLRSGAQEANFEWSRPETRTMQSPMPERPALERLCHLVLYALEGELSLLKDQDDCVQLQPGGFGAVSAAAAAPPQGKSSLGVGIGKLAGCLVGRLCASLSLTFPTPEEAAPSPLGAVVVRSGWRAAVVGSTCCAEL